MTQDEKKLIELASKYREAAQAAERADEASIRAGRDARTANEAARAAFSELHRFLNAKPESR